MNTYLPNIRSNNVTAQNDPVATFAALWLLELGNFDSRPDVRLFTAAQLHAEYLAGREGVDELLQSMHVGKNGTSPNERVRAQGYQLPGWWPVAGNQVECCVRCGDDAADALSYLLASPAHRPLMLREGWYSEHIHYGIGHAGADWVVVSAPVETVT